MNVNDRAVLWRDHFLCFCLAVFFSFFFLLPHASLADSRGNDATHLGKVNFHNDDSQPIHLPLAPDSNPLEPEIPGEGESDENSTDALGELWCTIPLEKRPDLTSGTSSLSQLILLIENRSKVSLFILHHSWKCFFSNPS